MKRSLYLLIFILAGCGSTSTVSTSAQQTSTAIPSISDKTKGMTRYDGYFNFYYNDKTDKIWLEIDKLNQEFIYVVSLSAGVGSNDIGLDRAQLGGSQIVYFERIGPKVMLVEPNYRFRADSDNEAEVKAVDDAFARSIHWGFKVAAEENGRLLVDATDFLLRDAHNVAGRLKSRNQGTYTLDKSRSAFYLPRTKNFPLNSEFESILTFKGTPAGAWVRSVTPDASAVTVREHHSFVQLPDDNYTPRKFDPRTGFGAVSYYDYATPISEPLEKKFTRRHRLKKKDPSAEISEAVDPIVYYLDPGTPEPIRSALLEGASWWNQAFEAAGYKDGFQVKMLPEDADPMDLRYNVINWVHRSTRGWSYGSSVTDPRTGEIIKGHVTLGSLRVRQDFLIAEGLLAPYVDGDSVPPEMQEMALARLRQLSAHEVGHTIGLAHSYASSSEDRASVMDYPHPFVELSGGQISLDNAYDDKIGDFDKFSITWGYQDFPESTDEDEALESIVQKSLDDGLTFLSDQDARPQGSAHPYAHLWDNGKNVAVELDRMLTIRQLALNKFGESNIRNGVPMSRLEEVLAPLYFFHRYQTEAAVKLIGGLEYRNALRGDGQFATREVSPQVQRQALKAVLNTISSNTLTLSEQIIEKIPPRSYGTSRGRETIKVRTGVTFDPISAAESAADMTLGLLLNPQRAARLVEFNSRDARQPGLAEVVDELYKATFMANRKNGLQGEVQRTVEQITLHNLFELSMNPSASTQSKAIVRQKLIELLNWIEGKGESGNFSLDAHYTSLLHSIESFMDDPGEYVKERPLSPPDGSPIGTDPMNYCDFDSGN